MIDLNLRPGDRDLRLFGGLWLPIALCLVAFLLWRRELPGGTGATLPVGASIAVALAVLSACVALPRPQWLRPIWVVLMVAAFPIGYVMSHVVLGLVYYAVVTPLGLAMRMAGKDPISRRPDPAATTYWILREDSAALDGDRYFRQF